MFPLVIIYIIHQLLCLTSKVESLTGPKVMRACNHEFPFIASLQYYPENDHFCSGALITRRHVITSAHCIESEHPTQVRVALWLVDLQAATVRYAVAFLTTYNVWANQVGLQHENGFINDIGIVTLAGEVNQAHGRPIRLTALNKQQVQGKKAIIIGWNDGAQNEVLRKAVVNVLSDADCENKMHLIKNVIRESNPRELCTFATPYVLLRNGDSGGPLVDAFGALLGVNFGDGPRANSSWGNFTEEFLQQYQVNLHYGIDYYRHFIVSVTGYQ